MRLCPGVGKVLLGVHSLAATLRYEGIRLMSQPNLSQVPLLGALCVAAGLVSQEDLDF